jgi:hypothetical protein
MSVVLPANMQWASGNLQSILGRIIGDPTHRLECQWVEDNGVRCQNFVSKDSRQNGAICLKMFQDLPTGHSPAMRLLKAASYMLCTECRRCPSRPRKCAQRWMDQLHAHAGQIEEATQTRQYGCHQTALPAQSWPTSMSYIFDIIGQDTDQPLSPVTKVREQSFDL